MCLQIQGRHSVLGEHGGFQLSPILHLAAEAQQPRCVAWVDHPVYFLNDKYDSFNLWHALEDVTHAFEAYALKGWGAEAQVRPSGGQQAVAGFSLSSQACKALSVFPQDISGGQ